MVKLIVCVEGAGPAKPSKSRLRRAFSTLFEKAGIDVSKIEIRACESRGDTFNVFRYVLSGTTIPEKPILLIDSEAPVEDFDSPWTHLKKQDGWDQPKGSSNDQVLFMTTCMETWIAADQKAVKNFFGSSLKDSALPSTVDLEKRATKHIIDCLLKATKACKPGYSKSEIAFKILEQLNPDELQKLPSFARAIKILKAKTA